ncbi:MAG: hypothetical protein KME10_03480 [Plectolyngbya sp. WJT66-NPBG17]|jgi:hypothetical protein|nr:hypothetical protein [Plectolyngbya sp. WJT66-NPBG17]MBW4526182.1 hypothetical protein [Phormidium tanganyikae FI6-MK23]
MNKVASEPPSLWKIPDIVVLLLMPIAVLFVVIDVLLFNLVIDKNDRSR